MKYLDRFLMVAATFLVVSAHAQNQVQPTSTPGLPVLSQGQTDWSVMYPKKSVRSKAFGLKAAPDELPDHVNNIETGFFCPVFNQSGGSCGAASGVSYMWGYEINAMRGWQAEDEANRFPSHFTWLMSQCNSDEATMLHNNGAPSVKTYGGQTYSRYFGLQDVEDPDFGWMQGYDKWWEAMQWRAESKNEFPVDVSDEAGRQAVKRWLYNHNGDTDGFHAGGICNVGLAAGPFIGKIEKTAVNEALGLVGFSCVKAWNHQYNHAMTIVGYDDRIEFDLDSNGVFGEKDKDEVGAWLMVNSWGQGWATGGFIYCPYKYGGPLQPWEPDRWFKPGFYKVRRYYRPLRTFKIRMNYSKRSEICLGAGVSRDTTATEPEETLLMDHFKYAGNGANDGTDPDVPMLGRWADGMHYEPMEFGYDITDLTVDYDRTRPLKYFFFIDSKKTANGEGNIYNVSLIDYETQREGVEIPFHIDTVQVLNGGKTTMISVIVKGEQLYKPLNAAIADKTLSWQQPQPSSLTLNGYYIYANNELIDSTAANVSTYNLVTTDGLDYSVAAVYLNRAGERCASEKTTAVRPYVAESKENNDVVRLNKGGFVIPRLFLRAYSQATIEWWMKPITLINWNQQVGPGWGRFLFHAKSNGGVSFGWNSPSGQRYDGSTSFLSTGKWTHMAITVDQHVMTLYVNGMKKASVTCKDYSGLSAFGDLDFGDNYYYMNADIDEVRVWSTCRSAGDLFRNKDMEIANPSAQKDLMAYFKMDTFEEDGVVKLRDCAHGHHALFKVDNAWQSRVDNSILKGSQKLAPFFDIEAGVHYAGVPVHFSSKHNLSVVGWQWQVDGLDGASLPQAPDVDIIFPQAGEYAVKLTQTDADGNVEDTLRTLTIMAAPQPVADFEVTEGHLSAGHQFSFVNQSQGDGYTFRWTLPGAREEAMQSTHATAIYEVPGTYDVTLTMLSATGDAVASVTKQVTVTASKPEAAFDVPVPALVRGGKAYLVDQSKYAPDEWMWLVKTGDHYYSMSGGGSQEFVPTVPGVYDVTLTVKNAAGKSTAVQSSALIVTNEDSGNGLNFGGNGQLLSFDNPLGTTRGFTIDWWMMPRKTEGAFSLASNDGQLNITTDADGIVTFVLGARTMKSETDYVIAKEWHHYSVVYTLGKVTFYRDGVAVGAAVGSTNSKSFTFDGPFVVGSATGGMNTMIDEFRIYARSLPASSVKHYCNSPIANVDSVETADKLVLYYNFNHITGNAIDLCSGGRDGVRTGFGPDGDAWASSLGVFSLNFDAPVTPEDVTADYMTNYRAPFYHTSKRINSKNTRFIQLETDTERSGWKVANHVVTDTIITGVSTDANYNYAMHSSTGWYSFAERLSNHLVYQTVELPEGVYRFQATVQSSLNPGTCYLTATEGDELISVIDIENTLAYASLANANAIDFYVPRTMNISLGLNINQSSASELRITSFKLQRIPVEVVSGISSPRSSAAFSVQPVVGGLRITTPALQRVSVYTTQGLCLWAGPVSGSRLVVLPKGIYIVNGQKVAVTN